MLEKKYFNGNHHHDSALDFLLAKRTPHLTYMYKQEMKTKPSVYIKIQETSNAYTYRRIKAKYAKLSREYESDLICTS